MDEKGFAFTPLSFLLIIPVIVIAIAYGNIVNEANLIGSLIIGGDVTYTAATSIFTSIEKGAGDAGRNTAYNATRKVIDDTKFIAGGTSKTYITNNVINALNIHIVNTTLEVERQTGRQIYINNIPINSYSDKPFTTSNVNIYQTDPFGFYVNVQGGIPVKIEQQDKDQVYEVKTPNMTTYVSIQGLEDPYIWIYSKFRISSVIYKYPYYTYSPTYGAEYHFDTNVDIQQRRLHYLWECLNGTDNPNNITPRSYYFPDTSGLSFFDRLEGKNVSSETDNNVKMSTFILGDPLMEDHGRADISRLDHEYFTSVVGTAILLGSDPFTDSTGSIFYLSPFYLNKFSMSDHY